MTSFSHRTDTLTCGCCINCILLLQTARFLLKGLIAVKTGKTRQQPLTGSMSYVNTLPQELGSSCSAKGVECWADPNMALAALRQRAARLLVRGAEVLQVGVESFGLGFLLFAQGFGLL